MILMRVWFFLVRIFKSEKFLFFAVLWAKLSNKIRKVLWRCRLNIGVEYAVVSSWEELD